MMQEQTKSYGGQPILTEKELKSYRALLENLDEKAHQPGEDLTICSKGAWAVFNPEQLPGKQIYNSFSDGELLDVVIYTMNHQGHRPDFNNIYCIYLKYLRKRFGGQDKIKARAKARMKHLRNEARWSLDWPEYVSPVPVLEHLNRNRFTENDKALLENICLRAQRSASLPSLTPEEKARLNKMGGAEYVLQKMGIPAIRGGELRHLQKYWAAERKKQAAKTAEIKKEDTRRRES